MTSDERADHVWRHAVIAQMAAITYLEVIEWVPMAPWNDLSRGNGQGTLDIAIGVIGLTLAALTLRRFRAAAATACCAHAAWLALQVHTWWVPYISGASPQWERVYARWFAHTWRFLPEVGNHPVPDASHTVLHGLLLWAVIATWRAVRQGDFQEGRT